MKTIVIVLPVRPVMEKFVVPHVEAIKIVCQMNVVFEEHVDQFVIPTQLAAKDLFVKIEFVKLVAVRTIPAQMIKPA